MKFHWKKRCLHNLTVLSDTTLDFLVMGNVAHSRLIYRKDKDTICFYYEDSNKYFTIITAEKMFPEDLTLGNI